jgi:hypothetical protein
VPEIIEDGVTGFIVENEEEAIEAIERIPDLDRRPYALPSSGDLRLATWLSVIDDRSKRCSPPVIAMSLAQIYCQRSKAARLILR